jgi:hypothetical protein
MLDQRKQQRLRSALPLLLAVLPAIFTGAAIPIFAVDTPLWDEWLIGGYLEKFAHGTLSLRNLFEQQNEYRQFFPNLVLVGLGWLTSWDVRYWMAASFILAVLVSFNIYRLGKWSLGRTKDAAWAWFIANLIIFSPVQYENWLQGQQLVYFTAIACFTTALLVASTPNLRTVTKFSLCAVTAIISSFSSANGLLCWILLLPILAWSESSEELWRKKWWIAAWLAGFVGSAILYFHDYRHPGHDPLAALHMNPLKIAGYYLITLGTPLTPTRAIPAALGGFVLLTLFCWSSWRFWQLRRRSDFQAQRFLSWLSLGAYSVLTAALITFGRIGLDTESHLSPIRYTTFTSYLPVALVYLVPMMLRHDPQLRFFSFKFSTTVALRSLCVALVLLQFANYLFGIRYMSNYRISSLYKKSCSLFVNVVDDKCLTERVFPDLDGLKARINPADQLGFIRPGLIRSNRVYDIVGTQNPENGAGVFQSLDRTEDGNFVASGWAKLPDRDNPADAILLAFAGDDSSPIIFAIGIPNNNRDVASALLRGGTYGDSRWSESFSPGKISSGRVILSAWAFDASSGKAYKLTGEHLLQE